MKLLVLCLLPVVLSAPLGEDDKRFIFPGLDITSLFDLESVRCEVQKLLDILGKDPTEAACENECHKLLVEGQTLHYACPLICHEIQDVANYFHETPKPGDGNLPCGGLDAGGK